METFVSFGGEVCPLIGTFSFTSHVKCQDNTPDAMCPFNWLDDIRVDMSIPIHTGSVCVQVFFSEKINKKISLFLSLLKLLNFHQFGFLSTVYIVFLLSLL